MDVHNTLGASQAAQSYSASAGINAKQSDAQELMTRLNKLLQELRSTGGLASRLSDKLVGPRPEPISEAADKTPGSPNFLSGLRIVISDLERMPAEINVNLNRIDQSF